MKLHPMLRILFVIALMLGAADYLAAQIVRRETADPLQTGTASWIKVTFSVAGATKGTFLNDSFTGTEFRIDLNVDGDANITTNPGDLYTLRGPGDIFTSPPGVPGGSNDDTIYLPIRQGSTTPFPYDTNLRPWIWLVEGGGLQISGQGKSGPWGVIQYPSVYIECDDGIAPIIRQALYYDDGSGSSAPLTGVHVGNITPFDGYIDRIDLIWSEPMRTSNITVNDQIFSGLGSTINSFESIGTWNLVNGQPKRFTLWARSNAPNSGITPILTYTQPLSLTDRFREAAGAQFQSYADSHARAVTDKAGPAIISARTKRAMRRQPLAAALASKLIEVTFSEPLNFTSVQGSDFYVITTTTNPSPNPIAAIISPGAGSAASAVYEFQLSTNYATGDEVGTIMYMGALQVTDVVANNNGESTAATPPMLPTPGGGMLVPITDGIFPIITQVMTRDAVLPADLTVGGYNGWGYLDYVDVVFDHNMNTSRVSTAGLSVSGEGILTIGGTGSWVSANTIRVLLTATTPKVANTGLIPRVTYANPGDPNGLNEPVNGGLVEALYSSDITLSSTNGQALQVIDMAGPAVIRALTAGTKRIRMVFSEKVNTSGWPTVATLLTSPTFKWIVGPSYFDISGARIYFTGMTPSRRDSIVYLNHTGLAWTKNDSGAINYRAQALVYDLASSPNGNQQYDDDLSISAPTRALLGSDVKVERDNIPPILLRLETVDIDADGKLDHYRFVFDDLSPIYPKRSFKPASWTISGYDGLKSGVDVDINVYNPAYSFYQPTAINAYGDTVEIYVKFNETTGLGPVLTPYGGDTGDVPDVVVLTNNGLTDWADNPMAALPVGITMEKDKAGPAIMSAKTINRYDVEAFMSEDLADGTVTSSDFYLNMAPNANFVSAWPIREAKEVLPGKALINTMFYSSSLGWDPKTEGILRFNAQGDVNDVVNPVSNGNMQTDWVTVTSNAACMFIIQPVVFGAQVRGVPFDVQVIARDKNGNIDKNFAGYLTFSSNRQANEIVMPSGPKQLTEGIGVFRFTSWASTTNLIISASISNDSYPLDSASSSAISVIDPVIDQPDYLTVQDVPGDQGGYVTLKWPFSANHQGMGATPVINYYEIFYTINGEDTLHYWPQQISAYNPSGTGSTMMVIDLPVVSSDSISFYVRAVWVPPVASAKGSATLAAVTEPYAGAVPLAIHSLNGESAVTSVLGATGASVVSGTAIGSGRAIDNIAPMPPARLLAEKNGAAVKLHWNKVTKGVNGTLERAGTIAYDIYANGTDPYFNPESAGTLLATTADTSMMVNSGGLRQYFVVRAKDTDNKSTFSRRVGKYGFDLVRSSKPRYNYISLPLDTDISNAKQLAEAIGSGVKVAMQLDHKTNGYSTYYLPELNFPTIPFAIHAGMPVLIQADLTAPESWFYCGTVPEAGALQFSLSTAFKYTYNEIILPLDRQDITDADQLAAEIGGVDVLLKLSSDGRGFSQYWLPALKFGNPMTPFSIAPGEPVLIQVNKTAPALWPTNAR